MVALHRNLGAATMNPSTGAAETREGDPCIHKHTEKKEQEKKYNRYTQKMQLAPLSVLLSSSPPSTSRGRCCTSHSSPLFECCATQVPYEVVKATVMQRQTTILRVNSVSSGDGYLVQW
jgi:hypothetical protein